MILAMTALKVYFLESSFYLSTVQPNKEYSLCISLLVTSLFGSQRNQVNLGSDSS